MISNVSGNLTALDGVDNDFINNKYIWFFGEVEIIHFTKEADSHYHFILKEVDNYEDYLRKYFKEMLQNKTIECPVCKSFSFPANDFPGSIIYVLYVRGKMMRSNSTILILREEQTMQA
ncbi:MAG TPA: hypothetical protein LFW14_00270 [Rickettsia endosymbiont of Degeeriella rufa]|nr:hypothetical protein [Rickettsia endosymbiont of Degeeriella rufa]